MLPLRVKYLEINSWLIDNHWYARIAVILIYYREFQPTVMCHW